MSASAALPRHSGVRATPFARAWSLQGDLDTHPVLAATRKISYSTRGRRVVPSTTVGVTMQEHTPNQSQCHENRNDGAAAGTLWCVTRRAVLHRCPSIKRHPSLA